MADAGAGTDAQRFVKIYLQDHRAGAESGLRLAERCRDHAPDDETAGELARVVADIESDRRSLATIMAGLDVDPSAVKQVAGIAADRLGRLKLNGRAVRTSPLSALVEVEGLIGAVNIKRELWATLRVLAGGRDAELGSLIDRADDQVTRLRAVHARVAASLFGSPPGSPTTADVAGAGGDGRG
jgi:hypothetical protein